MSDAWDLPVPGRSLTGRAVLALAAVGVVVAVVVVAAGRPGAGIFLAVACAALAVAPWDPLPPARPPHPTCDGAVTAFDVRERDWRMPLALAVLGLDVVGLAVAGAGDSGFNGVRALVVVLLAGGLLGAAVWTARPLVRRGRLELSPDGVRLTGRPARAGGVAGAAMADTATEAEDELVRWREIVRVTAHRGEGWAAPNLLSCERAGLPGEPRYAVTVDAEQLGAEPHAVLAWMDFYAAHPRSRHELGTERSLRRLAELAAPVPEAPVVADAPEDDLSP